jgi:hypothetical protein
MRKIDSVRVPGMISSSSSSLLHPKTTQKWRIFGELIKLFSWKLHLKYNKDLLCFINDRQVYNSIFNNCCIDSTLAYMNKNSRTRQTPLLRFNWNQMKCYFIYKLQFQSTLRH